jgi:hypothetical protein
MDKTIVDSTEIYAAARDDFKVFVRAIIGLTNAPFHDELDDILSNPLYKKIVITYPRDHGKSTHLSVAYPLWMMAKNHNLRILLVSNTESISKKSLSSIIGHIDRNEEYQKFSKFCDPDEVGVIPRMKNYAKMRENWSGDSIVIDRSELNLRDPTIQAVGLFGSILSTRADIVIGDDIVNQENSATEAQRLKVIDWIDTTVRPVLIPEGTFIYLGNTWHQDDLVSRLLKSPMYDYRNRKKAIISDSKHPELWDEWISIRTDERFTIEDRKKKSEDYYLQNKNVMDDGVKLLWSERFDYGKLIMERRNNPYAFARMYQCDPSDRPDQKFKDAWLNEATRKGATMRLQKEKRAEFDTEVITQGVDLAISEKETADDTVILTLDKVRFSNNPEIKVGDIIIREIDRDKMSPNTVTQKIKDYYYTIQPDGIRVESNGYQAAIQRDLDDMGIPVHGYQTGGEKNDPYIGINSLAIYAEQGKLILPYDQTDPRTIRLVAELINEMRAFPDGHTGDALMALWFAFSEMRDIVGNRIVVPQNNSLVPKDPPRLEDPVVRKPLEHKLDVATTKVMVEREQIQRPKRRLNDPYEEEAERQFFRSAMGGNWHG